MKSKKINTAGKTGIVGSPKMGMGDNYGTGVKNPIGKTKSGTVGAVPVPKKKLGKPPKSLA